MSAALLGAWTLARLADEGYDPRRGAEVIAGTLAYLAPEQTGWMNRSIDARSDLYALGVVLYELLTGSLPFTASEPMAWVHAHIARRPVPPSEQPNDTPLMVSAIVMKLLAKTAEDRYQTAAGVERDLREESAAALRGIGFDGYAIGGLAVGEGQAAMFEVLDYAPGLLPEDRPRYLMGVGKPDDIVGAVQRGVDMMDCVLPSRSGRTGQAWTRRGQVNIKNARHADDPRPLDEECTCPACRGYSRAYLHHVFRAGEMISGMLLTWHNLHYYQQIMQEMRDAIAAGTLDAWVADFHALRAGGDIAPL